MVREVGTDKQEVVGCGRGEGKRGASDDDGFIYIKGESGRLLSITRG